jgi:uncharacterized protein (TIGR02266 family)
MGEHNVKDPSGEQAGAAAPVLTPLGRLSRRPRNDMSNEKRAHPRFPLILAVDYPATVARMRDYTENLSAGGLFIRTEREFQVGDRVKLLVSFPELLEPADLEVEVVRMRPAEGGLPAGVAVCVPADRAEDRRKLEQLTSAAAAAAEVSHPAYRVLLVEDNSLVAAMYTSALRRLSSSDGITGLAVEVAADGNEAFARVLATPPVDLVITDVYMPVLSGFALVEKIRAEPRLANLPIIVISSGGAEERDRLNCLGANFFLQKPVKYQDIVSTVRALLAAGGQPGAPAPLKGAVASKPADLVGVDGPAALDAPRRKAQNDQ